MSTEHGRFDYSPIVQRPRLTWPNGARVAVWVVPNVEHFPFDSTFPNSPVPGAVPDVPGYSLRDYGNRVGIWRIMEVLDGFGIRATAALNADVCSYAPQIIEAGRARRWEWMGHGATNAVSIPSLSRAAETAMIESTLERIHESTGHRPRGWLGPGLGESLHTPDLLAAAGVDYVADWLNDDQPYRLTTSSGPLYTIPFSLEINDIRIFQIRGSSASELHTMVVDQFDTLYREGQQQARVMAISLHPYLAGVPHRIRYLEQALAHIDEHEDVWWATGSEIVDAYRSWEDELT